MSNYSKHKVPEYLKDLKQVASDLSDMPYDKVVEFLEHFKNKIEIDAMNDYKGGRTQLSSMLNKSALIIDELKNEFKNIWMLCKKYMI